MSSEARLRPAQAGSATPRAWRIFCGTVVCPLAVGVEISIARAYHKGRLQKAPAIWLAMKRRAQAIRANPHVLPQSTLGKAVRYLLNEYMALVGYLRDGRFEIDSNLVENDVRPSAVGKKRWLFIGHPDAGWRSALIYTIIQSCRRYGINPQEYLTDALGRLPSMTANQVRDLLPARWLKARQARRAAA